MTKQVLKLAVLGTAMFQLVACNKAKFNKIGAVEYAIVNDVKGTNAKPGDILTMNITLKVGDSVFADSKRDNNGKPIEFQIPPMVSSPIEWTQALSKFSAGDSGVIRISADSIKKYIKQLPPFIKEKQMLVYSFKVISIKTLEQAEKEMQAMTQNQLKLDDEVLQNYFKEKGITPTKSPKGVYYTIEKAGSGPSPMAGDEVTVNYTGKTLAGVTFDSNVDPSFKHAEAFKFTLSQGQVIPGWDEGIAQLNKGAKATLYIPSSLAYGNQAAGDKIAPNSCLVFTVELVDFKAASASTAAPVQ